MTTNTIAFLLQGSLWLCGCWLIYRSLLRDSRSFDGNRAFLFLAMAGAFALPFLVRVSGLHQAASLPTFWLGEWSSATSESSLTGRRAFSLSPADALLLLWLAGSAVLLLRLLLRFIRVVRLIREAEPSGNTRYYHAKAGVQGAFFGYILIDPALESDPDALARVLAHEQIHAREMHSIDTLLAEGLCLVFWFLPFSWWLRRALAENQEFLADRGALKCLPGLRPYAELLLQQSLLLQRQRSSPMRLSGNDPLLHFFPRSPIKRRIIMLQPTSTPRFAVLRYTAAIALSAFSFLAVARVQPATLRQDPTRQPGIQVDSTKLAHENVDQMPQFPGGEEAMFRFLATNLKYPESAKKNGIEGRVFVQFVVGSDGAVRDVRLIRGFNKDCEEEAVRVVQAMPKWEPGLLQGKPVAVLMTLPMAFSLK